MLSNIVQLEHVVQDKVFRFVCANDAPIHFIKEALFQMQKYIGQVEDQALAAQKAAEPVAEPVPVSDPAPVAPEDNEHA